MTFQDVVSRASFSTTFHKNCGIGVILRTASCLKTVVGVSKACSL